MELHVGTSGFAYREWKGTFYPAKIAAEEMLRYYADRLGAVEINSTFYRMPAARVLDAWAHQVPGDFLFAFKAPQVITHLKRLRNAGEEVGHLFRTLSVLGGKLGPVLFQLPGSFRADPRALEELLSLIPAGAACAFEFRHPSWLDGGIPDILRGRGCSMCLADTDEKPAGEIVSTASWGYLRLRRTEYADRDLSRWARRILAQGWERAFVFIKHEDGARSPRTAMLLRKLAGSRRKRSAKGTR